MKTVRTVADLRALTRAAQSAGRSVGLVPTMGALHDGHLSLVRQAAADTDLVVVSSFVNPTQFNDPNDLAAYPRDEDGDVRLARDGGAEVFFAPQVAEVYPPGFSASVQLRGPLVETLEGAARGAGHFHGVTTVVTKLFGMSMPDRAYFGAKDAQQARVILALVRDLNIPVQIVIGPTVREADGLAMSSRNRRLRPAERVRAAAIYRALRSAWQRAADGERNAEVIRAAAARVLAEHDLTPEYLALVEPDTFEPAAVVDAPALLAVAARVGGVRLIDNVLVGPGTD